MKTIVQSFGSLISLFSSLFSLTGGLCIFIAFDAAWAEPPIPIGASFGEIRTAIEDHEARHPGETLTISEILSRLPLNFRSGFTLMHTSRSAQGASAKNPRVIMFGDDARTIMTFNGSHENHGHDKLEFASVNPKTQRLEFRSIQFPANDSKTGLAKFSQVNPPLCLGCHGKTPHYIWGQYARWPGAFGSQDDVLELAAGEREALAAFRKTATMHPRYQHLNFEMQGVSDQAPYRAYTSGDPQHRGSYHLGLDLRPNARLSMLLIRHQARSRIAEMRDHPEFDRYKFALTFYLAGCPNQIDDSILIEKTGTAGTGAIAKRLGSSQVGSWHFELENEGSEYSYNYYSGLWTFDSLLSYYLWTSSFASDVKWNGFTRAVPAAPAIFLSKYKLSATERGKDFWLILDREGQVLKGFAGSAELHHYANDSVPDFPVIKKMCQALAEAQPDLRTSGPR
jgi:hypothetical protein